MVSSMKMIGGYVRMETNVLVVGQGEGIARSGV